MRNTLNTVSTKVDRTTNRVNSKGRIIQLPDDYKNNYVLILHGKTIKAFCQTTHCELKIEDILL